MTGTIRLVLGDQLSRSLSGLAGLDKERDVVLMAEVIEEKKSERVATVTLAEKVEAFIPWSAWRV